MRKTDAGVEFTDEDILRLKSELWSEFNQLYPAAKDIVEGVIDRAFTTVLKET